MLSWQALPHVLSSLCWSRMKKALHQVTLATRSRSYQIQGTDVCLQDNNWHCTNIPKLASANECALQKPVFCKWTTPCGAIPKRYQITLTDLVLDCAQRVEWPSDLIFFASTWPTNTNTYLFYSVLFYYILSYKKQPSYVYCARLTETCHDTCILLLSRWSDCFYSPHLYIALDKSVC